MAFDRETNRPRLEAGILTGYLGTVVLAWADTRTLLVRVVDPLDQAGAREVQIGILRVVIAPGAGVVSRDVTSPPANQTLVVDGSWGNSIAGVASPSFDSLTTAGGDPLTVTLAATVGVSTASTDMSVVYTNGALTFTARQCALGLGGYQISCFAAEGVGRNLAFHVNAYGAVIARGGAAASYASPVLTGVSPAVIGTDAEDTIVISGREFGSAGLNALGDVVFSSPTGGDAVRGAGCTVTVNHTAASCRLPGVRGPSLRLSLTVAGQATASVSLATQLPVVHTVALAPALAFDGAFLCTRGGGGPSAIVMRGLHFGILADSGITVTASPDAAGARVFAFGACRVTEAHVTIACDALPAGYGGALWVRVGVLGVLSAFTNWSLAYAPPRVIGIVGALPTLGAQLSIAGTGLGVGFAGVVRVLLDGELIPGVSTRVSATNASLDEVVFRAPGGVGGAHSLVVIVGAQSSRPVALAYDRPVLARAALSAVGGPARYQVLVSGDNFGATVSLVTARVKKIQIQIQNILVTQVKPATSC